MTFFVMRILPKTVISSASFGLKPIGQVKPESRVFIIFIGFTALSCIADGRQILVARPL